MRPIPRTRNNRTRHADPAGGPDLTGYRMPELVGLSIAQAIYEWAHRYGVRSTTSANPFNAEHNRQVTTTETWEGFTGPVTANVVNPAPGDLVASYVTTPASSPFAGADRHPLGEGTPMPATTSVHLTVALGAGNYYLATADGDSLVDGIGDRFYVEVS